MDSLPWSAHWRCATTALTFLSPSRRRDTRQNGRHYFLVIEMNTMTASARVNIWQMTSFFRKYNTSTSVTALSIFAAEAHSCRCTKRILRNWQILTSRQWKLHKRNKLRYRVAHIVRSRATLSHATQTRRKTVAGDEVPLVRRRGAGGGGGAGPMEAVCSAAAPYTETFVLT